MKRIKLLLASATLLLAAALLPAKAVANDAGTVQAIGQMQYKQMVSDFDSTAWNFKGQRPALVDFNAVWCGPCKRLAPLLEQLAQKYKGKVDFYSVDVDKNKQLARTYGIQSVPMMLLIPVSGQPTAITGLVPIEKIDEAIGSVLLGGDAAGKQ